MTKSLTEKWKDMDFTDNHLYYWRMPNGEVRIMNKLGAYSYKLCYDGGKIEILAPVPSYDEYNELVSKTEQLEKKLKIATKALKEINKNYRFTVAQDVVYKALKEMEGVK